MSQRIDNQKAYISLAVILSGIINFDAILINNIIKIV
jgi:hypothetical protein